MATQRQLDKTHLAIAVQLGQELSKDPKHKVGLVLTRRNRIILTSYNGTVEGDGNLHEYIHGEASDDILHAEVNMLCSAARHGIPVEDCTVYLSLAPCSYCASMLIQAGISRVVFAKITSSANIAKLAGASVEYTHLKLD